MKLTNDSYTILICTKNFTERYYRDSKGWLKISAWAWFGVLYVGLMGNCLAYFLYVYGVKNIGALRTVLYQYLTPVAAILFALLFLKESITGPQLLGAGVVFAGIFLARSG